MNQILNISAYLFVPIADTQAWKTLCADQAKALSLKGTVLLAPEGINLFLAGTADGVRAFVQWLTKHPLFAQLAPKESWSERQPFRKLLVKVKAEVIRMNHPTIAPSEGRAPAVTPAVVRRWLDQGHDDLGRAVVMLDTRNGFEVAHGRFEDAVDWGLTKFSEFPAAAQAHVADLTDKTVVSYCTGGIRCEKAALYLRELGLPHVYQIDGGILKYFQDVGSAHYQGACFVFDEREALATDLSATK